VSSGRIISDKLIGNMWKEAVILSCTVLEVLRKTQVLSAEVKAFM
jgi:hypothetical protein